MENKSSLKVAIIGQADGAVVSQRLCDTIASWIAQTAGNIEFYILDGRGFYAQLEQLLSSLGMKDKTVIIGVNDIKNNRFGMKEIVYKLVYEPDNKKAYISDENGEPEICWDNVEDINTVLNSSNYYKFKYKKLCRKVDTALVAWDGKNSTINNAITMLKVLNKPVYIFEPA